MKTGIISLGIFIGSFSMVQAIPTNTINKVLHMGEECPVSYFQFLVKTHVVSPQQLNKLFDNAITGYKKVQGQIVTVPQVNDTVYENWSEIEKYKYNKEREKALYKQNILLKQQNDAIRAVTCILKVAETFNNPEQFQKLNHPRYLFKSKLRPRAHTES